MCPSSGCVVNGSTPRRSCIGNFSQLAQVDRGRAQGRLTSQAPEIDGVVFLDGGAEPGALVRARITGVRGGVDLEAEVLATG